MSRHMQLLLEAHQFFLLQRGRLPGIFSTGQPRLQCFIHFKSVCHEDLFISYKADHPSVGASVSDSEGIPDRSEELGEVDQLYTVAAVVALNVCDRLLQGCSHIDLSGLGAGSDAAAPVLLPFPGLSGPVLS